MVKNPRAMQEMGVRSLGWEYPLQEGKWQPTLVFLVPGESHGQRSLVGYPKELDTAEATEHACMHS